MALDPIEVRDFSNLAVWPRSHGQRPSAAAPAQVSAEREQESGHGHGVSENRKPKGRGLPHDDKREGAQPYAREVDDYSGDAAVKPPTEQPKDNETSSPKSP
jgi:hypothetical protein